MKSKYDKFPTECRKVPVQFGHQSTRPRRCKDLGWRGTLLKEPYWVESYYRIDKGEKGAGTFFYERRWKGDKYGKIDKDGGVWMIVHSITYSLLPDEIKKEIEKKED